MAYKTAMPQGLSSKWNKILYKSWIWTQITCLYNTVKIQCIFFLAIHSDSMTNPKSI